MTSVSRVLFVAAGLLWAVIGVLGAVLTDKGIGPPMILISERTDTALYGGPPADVLVSNTELATLRFVTIRVMCGLLVAVGLLTTAVAWFALGVAETWALGLLTVVGLVVLPYWWISFGPYRGAGVRLALFDIPPFMWVPGLLMPVAAALGWIDRLRG